MAAMQNIAIAPQANPPGAGPVTCRRTVQVSWLRIVGHLLLQFTPGTH